jgi:protein gp37
MTTRIEWATEMWNPITGCSPISEGCTHCYARRMANRLRGRFGYPADDPFRVTLHKDRLGDPDKWQWAKRPKRIFVCSMGDLFHEDVPPDWINDVYDAIWRGLPLLASHYNTYMLLTKRPDQAMNWLRWRRDQRLKTPVAHPHIWFGVTTENQECFDERVPEMYFPAGKHFISAEPLLGPLDLSAHINKLDWVIVGAETGPGARPLKIEWVENIIRQCKEAGVPVFVKKLGKAGDGIAWRPEDYREWPEVKS